jgi:DNA transformation protein and related proteins
METSQTLEDLPNIGSMLAGLLKQAGINSPAELYEIGALNAFIRVKSIDNEACFSKLCALEGAVEGIRWHSLSKAKKEELKHFFSMVAL